MRENVEVARRVLDAINRADLDAVVAHCSEEFEFDFSNSRGPMAGVYRGRKGAREFWTAFLEPWEKLEVEPEEEIELEDGRVLTVNSVRGRGHGSGAEVSSKGASVWTIRDGQLVTVTMYQSKEEALEALS